MTNQKNAADVVAVNLAALEVPTTTEKMNSAIDNVLGIDGSAPDHVLEAPALICGKPVGQSVGVVIVPAQKQEEAHVPD
ncbi:hypothetical protein RSP673_011135 [Ralstonia solanacearum P673]|uniref:hypothetical protein n=1 Tax=Ralstonia solanacearum TaxID=305 RepID=UPI0012678EAF|nr:hypothetical protein [Ralstonia solanacearum]MCL9851199.1 hypothetical protein [Ralstonia solanacearum]MCL9855776.1 hypothetical protein [Ralstonia solanacearum]MCL9860292.1 hypothetical protein [Ralstonia solanacearum]MCL9865523.1 hypothetical protein [Ralstonia solanacearum]MCL9870006.1 hypothetical protein [Ralstonia solanacearum]